LQETTRSETAIRSFTQIREKDFSLFFERNNRKIKERQKEIRKKVQQTNKQRETITREMNRKGIFFLPKSFPGLETR
jgi:hypothetical protein